MTSDEKHQWEEDVIKTLAPDRDNLQAQLNEIRDLRMQLSLKNRDQQREYLMKLGELSFIFGAAIVPVVIVSGNKVSNLPFALVGAGLYLLNGLLALWRCKIIMYQDAEDVPQVGLDQELLLEPLIYAYNKLLHDPSSDSYRNEYINAEKNMLDTNLATQQKPRKTHVDLSADLGIYGFIAATLCIARTVWPFPGCTFWDVVVVFVLVVAIRLIVGYFQVRKAQRTLQDKRDVLTANRAKYQEWHNRQVLKK